MQNFIEEVVLALPLVLHKAAVVKAAEKSDSADTHQLSELGLARFEMRDATGR